MLAAGRNHTVESHPEALGQQIVNDGVCSRAQVEENTWRTRVGGRERHSCVKLSQKRKIYCLYSSTKLGCKAGDSSSGALLPAWHQGLLSFQCTERGRECELELSLSSCSGISSLWSYPDLPPAVPSSPQQDLHSWCPIKAV